MAEKHYFKNGKGKSVEMKRAKTVGADLDIEHDELLREYCAFTNQNGATLIRSLLYPFLDEYKANRDKAIADMLENNTL